MQNHYNLLYREEEREMLPLCADQGVGVIPWSPLARGRLTRPWDTETARTESDQFGRKLFADEDRTTVEKVLEVAERRGAPPAQVALAWLLAQPVVTSTDRRDHQARAPVGRRCGRRPGARASRRSPSSAPTMYHTRSRATDEGRPYFRILAHTPEQSAIVRRV